MHEDVLEMGHDAAPSGGAMSTRVGSRIGPTDRFGDHVQRSDLLGVAWVLASGLAILVPVFLHGWILGPYDLLSRVGLTKAAGVKLHIFQNSDLINSLIPWWDTVWQQVHQGHLPLWNPYGGLGMPLAFNWQSAPFSLPALIGYLTPMRDAFTVGVAVNIVVAGSGAYLLGRVLGMGAMASAAVGTVFELSGPIAAWLGYPFPAVMSWAGWILAIGLLLLRGRHRAGLIVALALTVAFSLYGGAPEGFAVLMLVALLFFGIVLGSRTHWLDGSGPILRPAIDLVAGALAGCALAAPFALPGLQVAAGSVRSSAVNEGALEPHGLVYLAIPGFDGLPIFHGGHVIVFGYTYYYAETAMYVGVIALVLAATAMYLRRRRPEVRAFSTIAILCLALVFVPPVAFVAGRLPLIGHVDWRRALMPLSLVLAVLAGYGLDLVVRSSRARKAGRRLGLGFAIAAVGLIVLWLFGRGNLGPTQSSIRVHSFIWPLVEILIGLGAAGFLLRIGRHERRPQLDPAQPLADAERKNWMDRSSGAIAGFALLAAETVFLVSAGATMVQSSPQSFPQTPVTREFTKAVGSATVAFGSTECQLGLASNVNDVYRVRELEVYDPIIPKDYFSAWKEDTGTAITLQGFNLFCPVVSSAIVAREFGVGYVLEPAGKPGPTGGIHVLRVGDEDLYRIPGSGAATIAPLVRGRLPADQMAGTPVSVRYPTPSEWHLTTTSTSPQALRLHLTNVPGWHATIDGKPLALEPYAGMMLQARIPAGSHTIVLKYWPRLFTEGIIVAAASALFLLGLLVAASVRKRGRLITNHGELPEANTSEPMSAKPTSLEEWHSVRSSHRRRSRFNEADQPQRAGGFRSSTT